MTDKQLPIRLDPNGPNGAGLGDWSRMDASRTDAPPLERRQRFFVAPRGDSQLRVSIWECDPYSEMIESYPFDEFMTIIEGSVILTDADGVESRFTAGESFFIARGTRVRWTQTERMKKYCCVLGAPLVG